MKTILTQTHEGPVWIRKVWGIGATTIAPNGEQTTTATRTIEGDKITAEYMQLLETQYNAGDALAMCRTLWEILSSKQAVKEVLGETE